MFESRIPQGLCPELDTQKLDRRQMARIAGWNQPCGILLSGRVTRRKKKNRKKAKTNSCGSEQTPEETQPAWRLASRTVIFRHLASRMLSTSPSLFTVDGQNSQKFPFPLQLHS